MKPCTTDELVLGIRDVPNFPSPGVIFKDITPLLRDARMLAGLIDHMVAPWIERKVTMVAGVEARGFLLAPLMALRLGVGMVPIRKPGKLPWHAIRREYALEYGVDVLEIHTDAVNSLDNVLVVDDVLATGGTAAAAVALVREAGASVIGAAFAIELEFLQGRLALPDVVATSVLRY
jgi:adenine phosphoribosyltransferase